VRYYVHGGGGLVTRQRLAVAFLLFAVLGTGGFFAGRAFLGDGGTQAQRPNLIEQLDAVQTLEAGQRTEDRFVGELLGIYIAPSLEQLPREIQEERERQLAEGCTVIPVEQAAELDFPGVLVLPPGYVLSEQDAGGTGFNPYAFSCSGNVGSIGWTYDAAGPGGTPGTISIVRSTNSYDIQDVAASQVSTEVIRGREALVIRPASRDGLAQRHLIYFHEPFGMTFIHAFNLPESEVLKVAEAVAEASQ